MPGVLPGARLRRDLRRACVDSQVNLELGELQKAKYCLEQVIRNLPGTSAEQEARRLLATLKQR
jgi:hypothetical protein